MIDQSKINESFKEMMYLFEIYENNGYSDIYLGTKIYQIFLHRRTLLVLSLPQIDNIIPSLRIIRDACYKYEVSTNTTDRVIISLAKKIMNLDSVYSKDAATLALATVQCSGHNIRTLHRGDDNFVLHQLMHPYYLTPHRSLINSIYKNISSTLE